MKNVAMYISAVLMLSLLSCNGKILDSPSPASRRADSRIPLRLLFKQNGDNGKYGYLDRNGKIVIEPKFEYARPFYKGFASVAVRIVEGKDTVIDTEGKNIGTSPLYSYSTPIVSVPDGMICFGVSKQVPGAVYYETRYGYADFGGRIVIEPKFIDAWGFSEGLAGVALSEAKHRTSTRRCWNGFYIDKSGKTVIPGPFCEYGYFSEGFARVKFGDDRWRYIDKKGRFLTPSSYCMAQEFSEGLAAVCEDKLFGYIDKTGKLCIPYKFTWAERFSEGLARVEVKNKKGDWLGGFIDKSGKYVIEPQFTYTNAFSEGLAFALEEDEEGVNTTWSGFIDKKGNRVLTIKDCHAGLKFKQGLCAVWITTGRSEENVEDEIVYINKSGQIAVKAPPNCRLVAYNPWED